MNAWHDLPAKAGENLNVFIENSKLSRIKYEIEKETGLLRVDRFLYSPVHFPANYGFVPQTLWEDGDALDVFVLGHEPLIPGCVIEVRPIGTLEMNDSGDDDLKVLAVPAKDPRFNNTKDIKNLEPHLLAEIKHFLQVYKQLQNKEVKVGEWSGKKAVKEAVDKSIRLYKEKFQKK